MSSQRILVVGQGYDLDPLVLALRGKGVQVNWLCDVNLDGDFSASFGRFGNDSRLQNDLAQAWQKVVQRDEFWLPLTKWGIGRNAPAESALSFWWHRNVPKLWQAYQSTLKVVSRERYLAAVSFEAGVTLSGAIMQAARANSVPRLIYQHGSTSRIRCTSWYSYLLHSDRFLTYGYGTVGHLQRTCPHCRNLDRNLETKLVAVGSARLDALRRRINPRKVSAFRASLHVRDQRPIILYVPTYLGSWEQALGDTTGYSDVNYLELQERVIRLFADFPGLYLLYKDVAAPIVWNPIPDLIRREISNGRVVTTPRLSELYWAVDGIIIDHAITGIGEALLSSKRLVVYNPVFPGLSLEPPEARALLSKRACVAATPDEFVDAVKSFLGANDFSDITAPDDQFLQAYCTHLNDGHSVQRAVDVILNTAREDAVINAPRTCGTG